MINKIGIKNFKIFQDLQYFNLDKINILTGTNGVGKSTFQNAFRLLKEVLVFDEKQRLVSIDHLKLSAEQKLVLGSLKANVSYDSPFDGFCFSFCFKHPVFGDLRAELQLNLNEYLNDELQGTLLQFYKEEKLIADFILEFDDHDEIGSWGQNQDSIDAIIPHLHHSLIAYKDLIHEQEQLCILDKNLGEDQELSTSETALFDKYKSIGYRFNAFNIDDPKHKKTNRINDETGEEYKEQHPSTILLPDGSYFIPIDNQSPFLNEDFTDVPGLLFNSEPLTLVMNDNSLDGLSANSKYEWLYQELVKANVTTVGEFKSLYNQFEKEVLLILLREMIPAIYVDSHFGSIEPGFLEFLSPSNKVPTAPNIKNIINPIFRALLETGDLDWKQQSTTLFTAEIISAISNVGKNKYNQSTPDPVQGAKEEKQFLFRNTLNILTDSFKSIAVEFSKQLYQLLNKSIFAHSDLSFNQNYLLTDTNREKNPFLIFGAEYLNDLHIDSSKTIKFINKWLQEFEIADQLVMKPITAGEDKIGISYFLKVKDKERPLINFGRGINQFVCNLLSFCTNGVNYSANNTVFLEEPEVNLHPSFQSKLAEMIADAVDKFNCSVVIETHSEYFIRKFQYLVASPDHKVKADDITISYLYHPDKVPQGKKQVERLIIEEDGGLDGEFGKGFFDEASNWKRELMRLKHAQKN